MKQKAAGIYGSNAIRLKMVTDRKVIVQVTEIKYFGNGISRIKKRRRLQMRTFKRINGITKRKVSKQNDNIRHSFGITKKYRLQV
jgi:hypothetical protein